MDRQSIVDALKALQDTADSLFDGDVDSYRAALTIEGCVASLAMDLDISREEVGLSLALPCIYCGHEGCDGHCAR